MARDVDGIEIKFSPKKMILLIVTVLALIFVGIFSSSILENNQVGFYQIKQSWPKGEISIRNEPGIYGQLFGTLYTFKKSQTVYLSKDVLDGGDNDETDVVRVLFPDGWADVSLVVQYLLPTDKENRLRLQELYTDDASVKSLVRQQIMASLKNTGSLFNSGDAYADKRSDFIAAARAQLLEGLYVPEVRVETIKNADGTTRTEKRYSIKYDENDLPVIKAPSVLKEFGFDIVQFDVKDMDFDPKLQALIEQKKDAQKAQQAAITAKAEGDAKIAAEKATQEIEKIKQVTIAQKEKEVAVLAASKSYEQAKYAALTADENAKKIEAEGRAKAMANKLLVQAGLTPLERAQIDKETAIGVASELAKVKFPELLIISSGDNKSGGPMNPFDAVGLESFKKIVDDMKTTTK